MLRKSGYDGIERAKATYQLLLFSLKTDLFEVHEYFNVYFHCEYFTSKIMPCALNLTYFTKLIWIVMRHRSLMSHYGSRLLLSNPYIIRILVKSQVSFVLTYYLFCSCSHWGNNYIMLLQFYYLSINTLSY